jgi:hypothetical protein
MTLPASDRSCDRASAVVARFKFPTKIRAGMAVLLLVDALIGRRSSHACPVSRLVGPAPTGPNRPGGRFHRRTCPHGADTVVHRLQRIPAEAGYLVPRLASRPKEAECSRRRGWIRGSNPTKEIVATISHNADAPDGRDTPST